MFNKIVLFLLLFIAAPITANAQGFLFGVMTGAALFGGSDQYGGGGATVLYVAPKETLEKANPMTVRQVAKDSCFADGYSHNDSGKTLGEIFREATDGRTSVNVTILQIVRVFNPVNPACAVTYFVYTE